MRILLHENLSRRLRHMLSPRQVSTVAYQSWRGVKNGALLALAEQGGFEAFLTSDQNLRYQQNLNNRKLAIVVLSINQFRVHRARIASIALAIENCTPGSVTLVDLGESEQT